MFSWTESIDDTELTSHDTQTFGVKGLLDVACIPFKYTECGGAYSMS